MSAAPMLPTSPSPIRLLLAILLASALVGCDLLPQVKDETADWSADKLYQEAHVMLTTGNYTRAIKLFDTLEGRFPYGRYAQQAILESAYANYRANEPATAIAACDRFIRTYPNHPNVDYAYYLKGLVNFREDQGILGYVSDQDLSERDPKMMRDSYGAFKELITRFPESRYARDSQARMRYLANALSSYEVHVATYYYRRGAYLAAVNRAQASLTNYPETPANEEALILLVRSYDKLGLQHLRDDSQRILVKTYPNGRYTLPDDQPWWEFWKSWKFWEKDEVARSDHGVPQAGADGAAPSN
jgi:outer membrane protein assembly factor BamD